ncbi:DegT/DnrJ/EryC1/StrS family aminotransferase [Streptomyces sp. NPDC059568]|uniref:DegT/DnrJ/EryC1/StrS family aminotransferase n=1 Tax=Streptomyces sp. NPDC059568 TaxID=3346868 RepID=UPI003681AEBE
MTTILPTTARLAIDGGPAVRSADRLWPQWPVPADGVARNLDAVLQSRRWAISSPLGTGELFERKFARMFAQYTGTRHCVPVDHGSSALVVALEALDLQFGDAVLVPSLTWTACATAVFRAGLLPVLVDVDPRTGCISADDLDLDVDARAVIAVHWSCAMADIPALSAVAEPRGITVIEDCAQAHGARWLGRPAGSLGRLGCFSTQNGKVLSAGEGGAVVTDDDALAPVLEELRADSRRYRSDRGRPGELELTESASRMGANFGMNEFVAAILCAQLGALEDQHEIRNRNYALLTELIAGIPGVRLLRPAPEQDRMSIYELPVIFDELPGGMTNTEIGEALTAELGRPFYPSDAPLHNSVLLQPWTKPALAPLTERFVALHKDRTYPHSTFFAEHAVVTHHSTLLGDKQDMADIAQAIAKVVAAGTHRAH